ncbi:MAG TPA: Ig-like domain-containing protein [Marmoricola sp.]|jgi:hypothetical protein|nr:Ig-like domain-containing protein [Marmoricola sp.]
MRARVPSGNVRTKSRAHRGLVGAATVIALCAAALVTAGVPAAQATQATGNDVAAWSPGYAWTYATTFVYNDPATPTNVTITENVTDTVVGQTTFNGQDAYMLNTTGTITGGSGSTAVSGVGTANLKSFSGTITGDRIVRRSDLALLEEHQTQNLNATASVSIISTGITATIDLTMTPNPGWKIHDFPLNSGDGWTTNTDIVYTGGFNYDAGSLGGTGSSPFDGDLPLNAPANVTNETINVPIASNVATNKISTTSTTADGTTSDISWWSPTYKNDAEETLVLPLSGAQLTIQRNLSGASFPSGPQFTATATPSLSCAGGTTTVSGALSTGASGVPVTVKVDEGALNAGQGPSATTTTGTNGAYSVAVAVPADNDGLSKNGSRANWGILVTAPSIANSVGATTVVVTPVDCSSIAYTGATSAPVSGAATVSAQLTDLAGASAGGRTVTFSLGGGGSVTGITNGSGVATATLPMTGAVRNTTVTASYAGAADLAAASASSAFAVQVNPTNTTVLPSETTAILGDSVTFSATVTPVVGTHPTGGVQFTVDGSAFGAPVAINGSGTAVSPGISTLGLGNHTVTATYNGDASFGSSISATQTFRVRVPLLNTSENISVTPNSTVYGQQVTLGSHISTTSGSGDVATNGSVTFSEGGTNFGTAAVDASGDATLTTTTIPVGAHSIVATYSGNDEYNGAASSPSSLTVAKSDTTSALTGDDLTTVSGQAVNYSVAVAPVAPGTGVPTGTAQLVVDGSNTGSAVALVGGVANFDAVTSFLTGSHTVAVNYSGDSNYKASSDSLHQTVTSADTTTALTISPSPSSEDQTVNITANVGAVAPGSGAATGLVDFTSDGDPIGSASLTPSSGGAHATLQTDTLAPGSHTIVATYEGDNDYNGSVSDPKSQTVIAGAAVVDTTTVVHSSDNPSTYGEFVSYTASVTAADGTAPSGAIQFSVDGTNIGDPVQVGSDGTAQSPLLASPEPGDHSVIAGFVGNPGYANSGDFLAQTVSDAGSAIAVSSSNASSSYGQGVTFSATVSTPQSGVGTPGGKVQFRVDGVAVGGAVTLSGGQATSATVSNLTPGTHTVTANYAGDAHFLPALDTTTQNVGTVSTTTALVATPSAVNFGQTVSLTASVTPGSTGLGAPTGTVTFTDGSTTLGTAVVGASGTNGTASIAVSTLGGGSHTIKATYSGSASFAGSASANSTVTVARLATTITAQPALIKLIPPLALPLGQLKINLNSANGPVAGVPVTFTVGNATVCTTTTDAYGVANCNALPQLVTLTLLGYKANFAGTGDYLPSSATGVIIH